MKIEMHTVCQPAMQEGNDFVYDDARCIMISFEIKIM